MVSLDGTEGERGRIVLSCAEELFVFVDERWRLDRLACWVRLERGRGRWEGFRIDIFIALAVSSGSIMNMYIMRRKKILDWIIKVYVPSKGGTHYH